MNKVGIHYGFWSHDWDKISYIPFIQKAARLGFDICEVASAEFGYYPDNMLKDLKMCAEDNGIGFTYSIGLEAKYDLASDDASVREAGITHVSRIINSMPKVGATILNGVSYAGWQTMPSTGITMDEKCRKEDIAVASCKRLMKRAEDNGVTYCFEAVNRFEQYLINTAEEAVAFAKRVDSPNAKILLDTFHMNIEEDDMIEAIKTAGDYLAHFHIGENNRRPPGMGKLPWKSLAEALKSIGYQGALVMEPFILMGGTIPYDVKVWRDLSNGATEQQMDDYARQACVFVKNLMNQ